MIVELYHARLHRLPCVVCIILGEGRTPCDELHHVGSAEDRNDWAVAPLCHRHHQGEDGIHTLRRRGFFKTTQISDVALLAMTAKLFAREYAR